MSALTFSALDAITVEMTVRNDLDRFRSNVSISQKASVSQSEDYADKIRA